MSFVVLGQYVRIDCPDANLRQMLVANFAAMQLPFPDRAPDLHYSAGNSTAQSISLSRQGQAEVTAAKPGDFLYLLEKDLTVELQRRRRDLLFLHSAVVDWRGSAILLAGESGSGKSSTAWGLLHCGFRYLSDELSPVDLDSMCVFPYPHALCLKRPPPPVFPIPDGALDLGRTIHIPTQLLPGEAITQRRPIGAVFLVSIRRDRPEVRRLTPAEASARLYVAALNALAHQDMGLDAVVRIAKQVPCFVLHAAHLRATCALVRSTVEKSLPGAGSRRP